jgi:hypothetical protein
MSNPETPETPAATPPEATPQAPTEPAPVSMLDTLRAAAGRHAARRLGNPEADARPEAADYLAAARATGNALVLAEVRAELGQ